MSDDWYTADEHGDAVLDTLDDDPDEMTWTRSELSTLRGWA